MPVPGYQEFMRPLLEVVSDGQDRNVREVYSQTADRLRLSEADRQELIPSGTQRLLDNRLGWAKTYLLKAGLVESPRRAVIRITQRGREALAGNDRIDSRYLRRFPEFLEFIRGNEGDDGGEKPPIPPPTPPETTPEELIETGYRHVQSALASELLERVKTATPTFFEQLVVRLLVAMGYGGSMEDAGKAVGRSGDESIDGIIKEDRLAQALYKGSERGSVCSSPPPLSAPRRGNTPNGSTPGSSSLTGPSWRG